MTIPPGRCAQDDGDDSERAQRLNLNPLCPCVRAQQSGTRIQCVDALAVKQPSISVNSIIAAPEKHIAKLDRCRSLRPGCATRRCTQAPTSSVRWWVPDCYVRPDAWASESCLAKALEQHFACRQQADALHPSLFKLSSLSSRAQTWQSINCQLMPASGFFGAAEPGKATEASLLLLPEVRPIGPPC